MRNWEGNQSERTAWLPAALLLGAAGENIRQGRALSLLPRGHLLWVTSPEVQPCWSRS